MKDFILLILKIKFSLYKYVSESPREIFEAALFLLILCINMLLPIPHSFIQRQRTILLMSNHSNLIHSKVSEYFYFLETYLQLYIKLL